MGLRDFIDNARREASSMAQGAIPGLQAIGQAATDDLYQVLGSNKVRANGQFQLDDLARTATQEYIRQTPILPLLRGDIQEAGQRFYERPISGSLDFLGAGSIANQGLKLTSKLPGSVGTGSMRLRGYQQLDLPSVGTGLYTHELPSTIRLASGKEVPGREFLLRQDIENTVNGTFARRTARSPRATEGLDVRVGDTLADDPLIGQTVPRARYEPFARVGDALAASVKKTPDTGIGAVDAIAEMMFGPQVGSSRFGKRLAIRNRSRLKVSTQEMMAEFGRNRKSYRNLFGKDADESIGKATFLDAAGIKNTGDLDAAVARLTTPSGRKAVLTDDGVDLVATKGDIVEMTVPEHDMAERYVKHRDEMAEQLAQDIENIQSQGNVVVHTGGSKPTVLTPEMIRGDKEAAYRITAFGNLHIKKGQPKPEAPQPAGGGKPIGPRWHPFGSYQKPSEPVQGGLFPLPRPDRSKISDRPAPDTSIEDLGKAADEAVEAAREPSERWMDMEHRLYRDEPDLAQMTNPSQDGIGFRDGDLPSVPTFDQKRSGPGQVRMPLGDDWTYRDPYFDINNLKLVKGENGRSLVEGPDGELIDVNDWLKRASVSGMTPDEVKQRLDSAVERQVDGVIADAMRKVDGEQKLDNLNADMAIAEAYRQVELDRLDLFKQVDDIYKESASPTAAFDDYKRAENPTDHQRIKAQHERGLITDDEYYRYLEQHSADVRDDLDLASADYGDFDDGMDIPSMQLADESASALIDAVRDGMDPEMAFEMLIEDGIDPAIARGLVDGASGDFNGGPPSVPPTTGGYNGDSGRFRKRPPEDPPVDFDDTGDVPDAKELRRRTAEAYSRAAWYKNYLDNLVKSRVDPKSSDITQLFAQYAQDPRVREILDSPEFRSEILPSHKLLVAAQLEADKARLGANALSNAAIVRNNERLAMLTGKEGEGTFFVARPSRKRSTDAAPKTEGEAPLEVIDDVEPGDPAELIAKGQLDTNPNVHLSNYLRRKREASNQELVDTVSDSAVLVSPLEAQARLKDKLAVMEDDFLKPGNRKRPFVIIRPNGALYKRIKESQPLANTAARRLAEEGYHAEAKNIRSAAKEMYEASAEGDFSLGDMIRNPKLRGEMDDSHYMVPTEMYEAILNEVTDSSNALSSFLQATSTGFKVSVLHGRWPGWVVNNTVGSQIYLAMTGGLGQTIPHVDGARMVEEFFPDVLGSGSREMATGAEDLGRVAQSRMEKVLDSKPGRVGTDVVNTLSDWNQKIADEPARIIRIEQVIEDRFKNTQELAKARGLDIPDTLESRRRMLMDQRVREDIAEEVLDDMIDFTNMSKSERMWVSNAFPFWTFIKGSTKSNMRLLADHPGRTWLPGQIASFGAERTDEQFPGGMPEYLRNLLRVGDDKALSVGGFNPYGQQSQLLGGILGMMNAERPTGQEHPASMVNPAIIAPLESITNRDIYTDYPLEGNLLKNLGLSALESIPLLETGIQLAHPGVNTGKSVFVPSRQNTLLNFAGVPVRTLDEGNLSTRMSSDENRRSKNGVWDYWRFHDGV